MITRHSLVVSFDKIGTPIVHQLWEELEFILQKKSVG